MQSESKADLLQDVLHELLSSMPELRAAAVATADGLTVCQLSKDGSDLSPLTALAARAVVQGKKISQAVGNGPFREWSVAGLLAHVYVYESGRKGTLAILTEPGVSVGLLHQQARDAALAISLLL